MENNRFCNVLLDDGMWGIIIKRSHVPKPSLFSKIPMTTSPQLQQVAFQQSFCKAQLLNSSHYRTYRYQNLRESGRTQISTVQTIFTFCLNYHNVSILILIFLQIEMDPNVVKSAAFTDIRKCNGKLPVIITR